MAIANDKVHDRQLMKTFIARLRNMLVRMVVSLPDALFYRYKYFAAHRRLCGFRQPKRFSEKIFHRMRYPAAVFSELADKVAVRNYVSRVVGDRYLVPAFLFSEQVSPETFDSLPRQFVMKSNHSVGQLRIVREKNQENLEELSALANHWLQSEFPLRFREKHYNRIPPKIIFEHALLESGKPPADFKFNVFNPGPGIRPYVFIQHMQGRFEKLTQNLYLEDWTPAPFTIGQSPGHPAPRPDELDEMLQVAKQLSAPFGYLRVDFYLHEGRVYVGELTVTPGAGRYVFDPPEWDELLGEKFGWPERLDLIAGARPERALEPETPRLAGSLK